MRAGAVAGELGGAHADLQMNYLSGEHVIDGATDGFAGERCDDQVAARGQRDIGELPFRVRLHVPALGAGFYPRDADRNVREGLTGTAVDDGADDTAACVRKGGCSHEAR